MKQRILRATAVALVLLSGIACRNEEPDLRVQGLPTDVEASAELPASEATLAGVSLSLEASLPEDEDVLKAFNYVVKETGPELRLPEESVPSICVLSNRMGTLRHYLKINWTKTRGKNHLYIKQYQLPARDLYDQPIRLEQGSSWYIMGFLGGQWDHQNKRVMYDPNNQNRLKAVVLNTQANKEMAESLSKDIPIYFSWTPLTVRREPTANNDWVAVALRRDRGRETEKEVVRFRSAGVMMRVEVTNKESYRMKVHNLQLYSNALRSSSGYFDLASPPPTTNGNRVNDALPTWNPNDHGNHATFVFERAGRNQTGDLILDLEPGRPFHNYFLLWAMPRNPAGGATPLTHFMVKAKRFDQGKEQTIPVMEHLYVWGSTNQPQAHTRRIIKAHLYRPKMALEYLAKGYKRGNDKQPNFSASPQNYTWDNVAGTNSVVPTGYRRMNETDDMLALFGAGAFTFEDVKAREKGHGVYITVNGASIYSNDYMRYKESVIYGLRYRGGEASPDLRMQHSAWRYLLGKDGSVELQSVYLGPKYKGELTDIMTSDFWDLHREEIISRKFNKASSFVPRSASPAVTRAATITASMLSWTKGQRATTFTYFDEGVDRQGVFVSARMAYSSAGYGPIRGNFIPEMPLILMENDGTPFAND